MSHSWYIMSVQMQAQVLQQGAHVILNSRLPRRLEKKSLHPQNEQRKHLASCFKCQRFFSFREALMFCAQTLLKAPISCRLDQIQFFFFFCSQQSNLNQSQILSLRSSYVKSTENTESTLLVALISIFFLSHSLATGSPILFFVVKIFYSFWVINDNKYIDNKYKLFIFP